MTNKREIKITFTESEKRVDLNMIASAIAKNMRKGGKKDDKRNEVS